MQRLSFIGGARYGFPAHSPTRRFYLVSTPIAFCDDAAGRLWRYENYGFHLDSRGAIFTSGIDRRLIADSLKPQGLKFNSSPMQLQRNAMVSMTLSVMRRGYDETLDITQEVQLRNVP